MLLSWNWELWLCCARAQMLPRGNQIEMASHSVNEGLRCNIITNEARLSICLWQINCISQLKGFEAQLEIQFDSIQFNCKSLFTEPWQPFIVFLPGFDIIQANFFSYNLSSLKVSPGCWSHRSQLAPQLRQTFVSAFLFPFVKHVPHSHISI